MRALIFLIALALTASAAEPLTALTALTALKLIPRAQAKNLARIEARDGTPAPERWHILVHDAAAEHGLREFVVAGSEVVASRTVSQFAEKLAPEDVLAADSLKLDSDKVAKLAQQYALANNAVVATIGYELKQDGPGARQEGTLVEGDGKRVDDQNWYKNLWK